MEFRGPIEERSGYTHHDEVAREGMLTNPIWRERPYDIDDTWQSLDIVIDGRCWGTIALGAGVAMTGEGDQRTPRLVRNDAGEVVEDIGWTRITQLDLKPFAVVGTDIPSEFPDGSRIEPVGAQVVWPYPEADLEPHLDAITRKAREILNTAEATRRLVRDLITNTDPDELLVLQSGGAERLGTKQEREIAASVYNLALDVGRRDPVNWVTAVLGCKASKAYELIKKAEAEGLISRRHKPRKGTKRTTTKRSNSGARRKASGGGTSPKTTMSVTLHSGDLQQGESTTTKRGNS